MVIRSFSSIQMRSYAVQDRRRIPDWELLLGVDSLLVRPVYTWRSIESIR